jgi:hypothetical protein
MFSDRFHVAELEDGRLFLIDDVPYHVRENKPTSGRALADLFAAALAQVLGISKRVPAALPLGSLSVHDQALCTL